MELNFKVKNFVRLEAFREREEDGETYFYTMRMSADGETWNDESETDEFIRFFTEEEDYREQFNELLALLEVIAQYGAEDRYFRPEKGAHALPRAARFEGQIVVGSGNPIRLYCIRWSERIVILLNGGVKSEQARTAQECDNVRPYFEDAVRINRRFEQLFRVGDVRVVDGELRSTTGHEIEFKL